MAGHYESYRSRVRRDLEDLMAGGPVGGRFTQDDAGVWHRVGDGKVTQAELAADFPKSTSPRRRYGSGYSVRGLTHLVPDPDADDFDDPNASNAVLDDDETDPNNETEENDMPISQAHANNAHTEIGAIVRRYLDSGETLPVAIAKARKDEPELFAAFVAARKAAKAGTGPTDDNVESVVRDYLATQADPKAKVERDAEVQSHKVAAATLDKLIAMSEGTASQRLAKETAVWCAEHNGDPASLRDLDKARAALKVSRPDIYRDLAEERSKS